MRNVNITRRAFASGLCPSALYFDWGKVQKNEGKAEPETVKLMIGCSRPGTKNRKGGRATGRFQLISALLTQMNDSSSSQPHILRLLAGPPFANRRTWRMSDDNELALQKSRLLRGPQVKLKVKVQ